MGLMMSLPTWTPLSSYTVPFLSMLLSTSIDLKKIKKPSILDALPSYLSFIPSAPSLCFFHVFLPFFYPLQLDIWANNQSHFILVREQMQFPLRLWQQAKNKGFSGTPTPPCPASALFCRDLYLLQVPITSSQTCRAPQRWRDTVTFLPSIECGAVCDHYVERNWGA